ncbi:MAG: pilus assembly protein TadG-related protein [Bacteroidales bacterium]|nr:pilus assembly protein TadG-related protein [Bacteroidales bacterium]
MITRSPRHAGTFLPMVAVCVIGLFSFVALAVDLGMVTVARTESQNAADAAALAGARILNNKPSASDNDKSIAEAAARAAVQENVLFNTNFEASQIQSATAKVYSYNTSTQSFFISNTKVGTESWSAMEVQVAASQPTFFAKAMGINTLSTGAKATAVHRPRDIAVIIDFTGSMGFGSMPNWPSGGYSDTIHGLLTPDPDYPQFGHYGRYIHYQTNNTSTSASSSSSLNARPNPFQMNDFYGNYPPNNITVETRNGPPIVEDFLTAPGDPSSVSGTSTMENAFKRWEPSSGSFDPATAPTPAPSNFAAQLDSPTPYVGDKWPRADGGRGPKTSGLGTSTPVTTTGNYSGWSNDSSWTSFKVNGVTWQYLRQRQDFNNNTTTTTSYAWSTTEDTTTQSQREYQLLYRKGTSGGADTPTPDVLAATPSNANKPTEDRGSPSTSSSYTDGGALTVAQFLNSSPSGNAGRSLSSFTLPSDSGYGTITKSQPDGGTSLSQNYRDVIWETYGYDLDVEDYRNDGTTKTVKLLPQAQRFKGYSMGPGYFGKTFFIWPPDPRWGGGSGVPNPANVLTSGNFAGVKDTSGNWICDWRRRFFLRGNGQPFDDDDNINQILFRSSAGHILNDIVTSGTVSSTPGYYRINYAAVIAWLKNCGPNTLPTNLRSGRILYYSSMPDDLYTGSAGNDDDKTFLRHYVHYILGVGQFNSSSAPVNWGYVPEAILAGVEYYPWYTRDLNTTTQFDPNGSSSPPINPKPYMSYTDTPNFPRAHFWFGPMTMVHFMERSSLDRAWWSGTVHEAQCWQLKVAINSVLDDIRNNHPNDFVGIAPFAARSSGVMATAPMASMSQDWYTLKNVLFYSKNTVVDMKNSVDASGVSSSTTENRPYTSSFSTNNTFVNSLPNGNGSTDPMSGFALGFNLLSSSTQLSASDYGTRGRRGAAKIVIFETDGQPNNMQGWSITGSQADTRYYKGGSSSTSTGGVTVSNLTNSSERNAALAAIVIAQQMAKQQSGSGTWGFSTPNTSARIYSIMFGDLFEGYDGSNFGSMSQSARGALEFGLRVQQVGNTSASGDPPSQNLPLEHVITGDYNTRIVNLRLALERIMQSGVQVTLIE